jgi:hypothetical protein
MLRDGTGDSLFSAMTDGVASFSLWSRQNVCGLAKETSQDPKGATGTRAFELRARRMRGH